jgi:hypothetical protein
MNLFQQLPGIDELSSQAKDADPTPLLVNGHFHTPYSFSAFSDLKQVFERARSESIDVLGINDFYTTAGYENFAKLCHENLKFPLFNMELIGLLKEEQQNGIRVNDPINPGRTYFSGKGLDFPQRFKGDSHEKLKAVRQESDRQTREMLEKASTYLKGIDPDLSLDYSDVLQKYTKGMLRERHIAQVIRMKAYHKYQDKSALRDLLFKIYGSREPKADLNDHASVEGEIRSRLLKSGGIAYVKEDPKAFLELEDVLYIIMAAGGIPCYPVLLDDMDGNYTEFEANKESLHERLSELKVCSLEFIPGRNKFNHLKDAVEFFDTKGYIITFGTEHNTPSMDPLTVSASDAPLDRYLLEVNYKGACLIAAHQYLRSLGQEGYLNSEGKIRAEKNEYTILGNAVIRNFIKKRV